MQSAPARRQAVLADASGLRQRLKVTPSAFGERLEAARADTLVGEATDEVDVLNVNLAADLGELEDARGVGVRCLLHVQWFDERYARPIVAALTTRGCQNVSPRAKKSPGIFYLSAVVRRESRLGHYLRVTRSLLAKRPDYGFE